MLAEVADAYRRSSKPHDILWNRYVARALMALAPGWSGLIASAVVIELSYVLDCVDGQLARLKGTSSPVGAHLDFLMDELKAFLLVAAVAVRLWLPAHDDRWLLEGLG